MLSLNDLIFINKNLTSANNNIIFKTHTKKDPENYYYSHFDALQLSRESQKM